MILLAHIMGMPVEELLTPWVSGGFGAAMLTLLAIVQGKAWGR
jgi:hypothetical protein